MPATIVLSAVYGSTFMAAAALGAVGYAAATFAINLVAGYLVSKLFAPSTPDRQSDGSRVQLPPATNNKIPVVYGDAWLRPIVTDAKISTDQTQMWYVLTLCEKTDTGFTSIGDIYWGDKLLNFDGTDQTKVVSWTEVDGNVDTRVDGKINIYKYNNGSLFPQNTAQTAISVLQNAAIDPSNHWTSTDRMDATVFVIVRVTYNEEIGLVGLDNLNIKISNNNTLPGTCIFDYLNNERYGCGIPSQFINLTSLNELNTYSNQLVSYIDSNGNPQTQPRYRFNGPVDVGNDCFQNLTLMAEACDSWIQWNESQAKWGVIINKSYTQSPNPLALNQLFSVNDNNIIGGIDLNPVDLNSTYNRVEVQYPDKSVKDNQGFEYIDLDEDLLNPNEPDNILSLQLPLTNSNITAKYLSTRRLLQSREDLVVTFNMDYSGMQIDAGDVIRINNTKLGWVDKLFRVVQVVEGKDDSNNITIIQVTANEYNDDIYGDFALTEFVPSTNTGITDPNFAVVPGTPFITNISAYTNPPRFDVNTTIPLVGTYNRVEIYISRTGPSGDYVFLNELVSTGIQFTPGSVASFTATSIQAGTLYFKVRLKTITNSVSAFSNASAALIWNPAQLVSVTDILYDSQTVPGLSTSYNMTVVGYAPIPRWVALGQPTSGGARLIYSSDSTTWVNGTLPAAWQNNATANDIVWDGLQFVAVGNASNTDSRIMYSADGISWTNINLPAAFNNTPLYSVAYGNGVYIAVSDNGEVATSPDGLTWTKNANLAATAWGNTGIARTIRFNGSYFVIGGDNGRLATTTDGITFTYQSQLATTTWGTRTSRSVAWNGTVWCLVGSLGGCATSSDGITWVWRNNFEDNLGGNFGTNSGNYIIWNSYRFVACGEAGRSAISTDGITWLEEISLRSPTGGQFPGNANMIAENELYKLVAVGDTIALATTPPL